MGAGGIGLFAQAASAPSSLVPITPCRLFDTRPASVVGTRTTPVGSGETFVATAWGTNGNCTIPAGATGLSLNVVAISPTASSYLTVFPSDQPRPLSSSLNWIANQPPTPNGVTVALSADGKVSFFINVGAVDLAADVVGYYQAGGLGTPGPKGDKGDPAQKPAHVIWVATSGGDFTTVASALASITDNSATSRYVIKIGPGTYTEPNGISMKDYVDIEGSGENVTTLTATSSASNSATVSATANPLHAELRNLSVANTGGGPSGIGILVLGTAPTAGLRITDITASSTGATSEGDALRIDTASPTIANITASASANDAVGISLIAASPTIDSATVTISSSAFGWGILAISGSAASVTDSTVTTSANTYSIGLQANGSSMKVSRTSFTASGSTSVWGIYANSGASVTLTDSFASGSDGVQLVSPSTLIATGSTISGSFRSIEAAVSGVSAKVSQSTLTGGAVSGNGFACHFNVDENGVALADGSCAG